MALDSVQAESYPSAVWAEWKKVVWNLFSIAGLLVGLAVVQLRDWSPWALLALVLLSLFIAQWRAWDSMRLQRNHQHERAVALENQLDQREERRKRRDALAMFQREGNAFYLKQLASDQELEAWAAEVNSWVIRTADWIGENLSPADRALFLDKSGILAAEVSGSFNKGHSNVRLQVAKYLSNLNSLLCRDGGSNDL